MYIDYRLGLGIKLGTEIYKKSRLDFLNEVSSKKIDKDEYKYLFEDFYIAVVARQDFATDGHGSYLCDFYLCKGKIESHRIRFPACCKIDDISSFEEEKNILKSTCEEYGFAYNEKDVRVIIDSNDY